MRRRDLSQTDKSRSFVASLLGMTRTVKRAHVFDDLAPPADLSPRGRQSLQQPASIAFGHDAWIGDDDDAEIGAAANQSAEALLETERRVGQHVLDERVAALGDDRLAVRRRDRLRRHAKG